MELLKQILLFAGIGVAYVLMIEIVDRLRR